MSLLHNAGQFNPLFPGSVATHIIMSKLSPNLKALINAAHSRPGPGPAPRNVEAVYQKIAREAAAHKLGRPSWLALSTAATMTMNSPDSMLALYNVASASQSTADAVAVAELMREVGLKCIGFNGVRFAPSVLHLDTNRSLAGSANNKYAQRIPRCTPALYCILVVYYAHSSPNPFKR